jgi:hypothetical protein
MNTHLSSITYKGAFENSLKDGRPNVSVEVTKTALTRFFFLLQLGTKPESNPTPFAEVLETHVHSRYTDKPTAKNGI